MYSWEASIPNKFGVYSSYVKLTDNTIFSNVNESVLEEFYFRQKFRVRCTVQYSKSTNWVFKSDFVEINDKKSDVGKCSDIAIDIPTMDEMSSTLSDYTTNLKSNTAFQDAVNVKAEYISEYADPQDSNEFIQFVKLSINLPHIKGMLPFISTTPLHNCRYLMTDSQYAQNHICSNFIPKNMSKVAYGFIGIKDEDNKRNDSRDARVAQLYSNLNSNECQWEYTAYYDIDELINNCQAQLTPEPEAHENVRSFMTLKVPLYVSYLYANDPIGWNCIEYKTNIETSINYRIAHDNRNDDNFDKTDDPNNFDSFSLAVKKVSIQNDGKLFIELSTLPSFNGHFVKSHPSLSMYKSRIYGPDDNIDFTLDLFWTQYSEDQPRQIWKIRSTEKSNVNNLISAFSFPSVCLISV